MEPKVIVLSSDYGYVNQITTTIKSIVYNMRNVKIYLINFDVPQEYFGYINHYLQQMGNDELVDLKINPEIFNNENSPKEHINKITYGRLLIPQLVSEDRVLYVDCDAILDADVSELWQIDLTGYSVAAVHDVFGYDFNAGILLLNNHRLKATKNIVNRMLDAGKQKGILDADQTVLNQFFGQNFLSLDIKYNYVIGFDRDVTLRPANAPSYFDEMNACRNPKIIHYASSDKPWNLVSAGRMRAKWWQYHDLDWSAIINHASLPNLSRHSKERFLTITASDQMVHLAKLAEALPDCEFNVVAFTMVSPTLLSYLRFPNVHVYPSISKPLLDELMKNCTAYLNINRYSKYVDLINQFAANGRPVFSFATEKLDLAANIHQFTFDNDKYQEMIKAIKIGKNISNV